MANPRVCAICLTSDRQAMTDRAVKSFLAQTYPSKELAILDSGTVPYILPEGLGSPVIVGLRLEPDHPRTIGYLRNFANAATRNSDIIAHWDSDDWSAPTRLAEQVAHLQASGADVVGFSDMLFWDTTGCGPDGWVPTAIHKPRAWLFNNHKPNYALGTSLMYWRRTWERKPFPEHTNPGCDDRLWVEGLKVASVSSIGDPKCNCIPPALEGHPEEGDHEWDCAVTEFREGDGHGEPRMVAEIHGHNTCARITEPSTDWTRVPAWDEKLRSIMAL